MPYGTKENGLAGPDVELLINAPIFVKHFQEIADLAKDGTFRYGGRTSEAKQIFLAGECGIYTDSSGGLGDIVKSGMNYGIGPCPTTRPPKARRRTPFRAAPASGSSATRLTRPKGVAAFFDYLSQTPSRSTCTRSRLPPGDDGGLRGHQGVGLLRKNPGREQPIIQMMGKAPTENSRGVRLVNLPQVRDIQNEEFEAMLAGKQTAQQALDNAVTRGNESIARRSAMAGAGHRQPGARRLLTAAPGTVALGQGLRPASDHSLPPPSTRTAYGSLPFQIERFTSTLLAACARRP